VFASELNSRVDVFTSEQNLINDVYVSERNSRDDVFASEHNTSHKTDFSLLPLCLVRSVPCLSRMRRKILL
jgi:hypothetical protein